jgi:hypothetical protein
MNLQKEMGHQNCNKKIIEMLELKPQMRMYLGRDDPPWNDVRTYEFSPSRLSTYAGIQ